MASVSLSSRRPSQGNLDWNVIVMRAKEIVESYSTGVTLRQLYYRLVSEGLIPNKQQAYKTLSSKTAAARREGWFPSLIDRTRDIEKYQTQSSPENALARAHKYYLRDRGETQDWSIYIGVEKHGMVVQLLDWFGELGIPVLALGGYSSQTFVDEVREDVERQDRQSVLLYAGDFDPSGMDIDRDFEERGDCFDEVERVALDASLVKKFNLPPMPGKESDSRSAKFELKHGELVQVELDALAPEDLKALYKKAIDSYFDYSAWEKVIKQEEIEQKRMKSVIPLVSQPTPAGKINHLLGEITGKKQLAQVDKALKARRKALSSK